MGPGPITQEPAIAPALLHPALLHPTVNHSPAQPNLGLVVLSEDYPEGISVKAELEEADQALLLHAVLGGRGESEGP